MIHLGPVISTIGAWSTIYRIENDPGRCAKVLAPHREYCGEFPDSGLVAREKYGIEDLLEHEYENYQQLMRCSPEELRKFFVRIDGFEQTACGNKALVMELVQNEQGAIAPNLVNNKLTLKKEFFLNLERLRREVFMLHSIDYYGIACRNILVRDTETPVLIDFQKNNRFFRNQFWLKLPFFIRRKVTRYFTRVYAELGQPDYTQETI